MNRRLHLFPQFLAPLAIALMGFGSIANSADCPPSKDLDIRIHLDATVGLPETHDDTLPAGTTLDTICYDRYCLQHNSQTKQPDWVVERLDRSIVCGVNTRPSGWKQEESVSDGALIATDEDYKHSGYSRGHNAASADFKSNRNWMKQTFVFSNAVPQVQSGFNGSYWRFLEEYVQDLALSGADLIVITGPVPANSNGKEIVISAQQNACGNEIRLAGLAKLKKLRICNNNDNNPSESCPENQGVSVPSGMYKIIHIPDVNRTFAFVMSNEDHKALNDGRLSNRAYLERWRVSLDVLEYLTNTRFFTRNAGRTNRVFKENCTETRWRI